jgi:hypothetical protein
MCPFADSLTPHSASQALDKIRFLAVTDKEALGEGDAAKLEMK